MQKKLLTALLLSIAPLTASANTWITDPGFQYVSPSGNQGQSIQIQFYGMTTFTDYTLSFMAIEASGYTTPWKDVFCSAGCDNKSLTYIPPDGAQIVFKLEADGNTYYAGAEGFTGSAGATFNYDNTGRTLISFGTPLVYSDFNFTIRNVQLGSLQSLSAVPEPEAYAMLLAGLGMIGAVARRRRKQ